MYHIYVHIPFCLNRCPYCYFTAKYEREQLVNLSRLPAYVEALCNEITATEVPPIDVGSVVFGGGTPSLLSRDQADAILQAIRNKLGSHLLPSTDIGYEIMPVSAHRDKLADFLGLGFTRVSVGVQSFLDEELRVLGRPYTGHVARDVCQQAVSAGYDTVNIDLLMAFPGQREAELLGNVATAVDLRPEQISLNVFYSTYPNSSQFIEACHRRGRTVLSFEERLRQYRAACALLAEAGYQRLDNTVFTRPDAGFSYEFDAISEVVPIISFGPGSGAFWENGVRYTPPDIEAYIARPEPCHEPLIAKNHAFTVVWGQLNTHGVVGSEMARRYFDTDLQGLADNIPEVQALLSALERSGLGHRTGTSFEILQDRFADAVMVMHQVKDQEFGYRLDTASKKED